MVNHRSWLENLFEEPHPTESRPSDQIVVAEDSYQVFGPGAATEFTELKQPRSKFRGRVYELSLGRGVETLVCADFVTGLRS